MNLWKILVGPNVEQLRQLPDAVVQTCVSSPPYWGLRDYGTGKWEGGDPDCPHEPDRAMPTSTLEGGKSTQGQARVFRDVCELCGARRIDKQIGLETSHDAYVAAIAEVYAEVFRVLRDDGTLWINLGDTYCSTAPGSDGDPINRRGPFAGVSVERADASRKRRPETPTGLKPKDMVGIPWRVAFALQGLAVIPARSFSEWADDLAAARQAGDWQVVELVEQRLRAAGLVDVLARHGWYLRADIIWSKPNPMPESVTDRPTKAHEYFFLFAKSGSPKYWSHRDRAYRDGVYTQPEPDYRWENKQTGQEVTVEPDDWRTLTFVDERGKEQKLWRRLNLWRGNDYYYDAEAIFEPYAESTLVEVEDGYQGESMKFDELESETPFATAGLQNPSDTKRRIIESIRKRQGGREARDLHRNYQKSGETPRLDGERWNENDGRGFMPRKNDDHVDRRKHGVNEWEKRPTRDGAAKGVNGRMPDRDGGFGQPMVGRNKRSVWQVSTQPYREAHFATYPEKLIEPCILAGSQPGDIVIDTFNGSGTTGVVATGYDRHYIGFELNPKYAGLSVTRISKLSPLFTREAVDLQELLEARRHDHRHSENEVPDAAPAESLEVSVDASRDAGSDLAEG
jgi:DNA modification methylase